MFVFIVFAPYFVCFSIIPLWATADKLLSTIIGKLLTVWRGILQNFSKLPSLYMDIYNPLGVFLKIFYTPSLLLESFKTFVGVFLKKFIKISHRADFGCFDFPAFMLETSTQKLFSSS